MRQLKILFIDDEPLICECFVDQFSDENVKIKTFADPEEALKNIQLDRPDLIFLDYRMPGTRGDKLALRMPSEIPKFLITGELEVHSEYHFLDILPKPFNNNRVIEIIESYKKKLSDDDQLSF